MYYYRQTVVIETILYDSEMTVYKNYVENMIYIKRNKFRHIPGKWDVVNTKIKSHDVTNTFRGALVFFLWHCGMSFGRAARLLKVDEEQL